MQLKANEFKVNTETHIEEVDHGVFNIFQSDGEGGVEMVTLTVAEFESFLQVYHASLAIAA